MPALSDVRFEAMRALGFTGATSDMLLQWLQAFCSPCINHQEALGAVRV